MSKNQHQRFKIGDKKIFIKSGNEVELVEPHGNREWIVKRTTGASAGKQMICRESSLTGNENM